MWVDPAHLAVLEQALAESPDNLTLRAHVAGLHLELAADDPTDASTALAHAQQVIAVQPDHADALGVAAQAAAVVGDRDLATRYDRIARALGRAA